MMNTKRQKFFEPLIEPARYAQIKTGISTSISLAQAVLESGWGKSELAKHKNLFGIKAGHSWNGSTITLPTKEFRRGKWVTEMAKWRVYSSYEEAFMDHALLFYNGMYEQALAWRKHPKEFLTLIAPVYATDPNYAIKVWSIVETYKLLKFEVPFSEWKLDASLVPSRWLI